MCNRHAMLVTMENDAHNSEQITMISKQPIYLGVLRRFIYGIFCVRMRIIAFP